MKIYKIKIHITNIYVLGIIGIYMFVATVGTAIGKNAVVIKLNIKAIILCKILPIKQYLNERPSGFTILSA